MCRHPLLGALRVFRANITRSCWNFAVKYVPPFVTTTDRVAAAVRYKFSNLVFVKYIWTVERETKRIVSFWQVVRPPRYHHVAAFYNFKQLQE